MDYFQLMVKMLRTFSLSHRTLLDDFRRIDFKTNLNRTQRRTLMHLYEGGRQTMSALCVRTELQKGSMTAVVDSLEELGYVKRHRSETDRREVYIDLTPEGTKLAEELRETMNQYLKDKLRPLSPEDIDRFSNILDQLWELNQKLIHQEE